VSPLYSPNALNWGRQDIHDEGKVFEDRSFLLMLENEPVIGFLGTVIEADKRNLDAYGFPCISAEDKGKLTTKVAKTFLKEFDLITQDVNGTIWCRDYLHNGEISSLSRHLLLKGARANPFFSKVIDLSNNEKMLRSRVRKSYGSLINWGLRELQPIVLGADMTWEQMLTFRQLHIREAGRETRSEASWHRQFELVEAGEAFVILAYLEHELVSAGFFMHSDLNCYYGVSVSRRDLFQKPLFHSLMWIAILHAKKLGCRWFEVGGQLYPRHPADPFPSAKEQGISDFKAGFGGATRVFMDLKLDFSEGLSVG